MSKMSAPEIDPSVEALRSKLEAVVNDAETWLGMGVALLPVRSNVGLRWNSSLGEGSGEEDIV